MESVVFGLLGWASHKSSQPDAVNWGMVWSWICVGILFYFYSSLEKCPLMNLKDPQMMMQIEQLLGRWEHLSGWAVHPDKSLVWNRLIIGQVWNRVLQVPHFDLG